MRKTIVGEAEGIGIAIYRAGGTSSENTSAELGELAIVVTHLQDRGAELEGSLTQTKAQLSAQSDTLIHANSKANDETCAQVASQSNVKSLERQIVDLNRQLRICGIPSRRFRACPGGSFPTKRTAAGPSPRSIEAF